MAAVPGNGLLEVAEGQSKLTKVGMPVLSSRGTFAGRLTVAALIQLRDHKPRTPVATGHQQQLTLRSYGTADLFSGSFTRVKHRESLVHV